MIRLLCYLLALLFWGRWHRHRWTRWEQFARLYTISRWGNWKPYDTREEWERRRCETCGKGQERLVDGAPEA